MDGATRDATEPADSGTIDRRVEQRKKDTVDRASSSENKKGRWAAARREKEKGHDPRGSMPVGLRWFRPG
jgi:hypothetical protein